MKQQTLVGVPLPEPSITRSTFNIQVWYWRTMHGRRFLDKADFTNKNVLNIWLSKVKENEYEVSSIEEWNQVYRKWSFETEKQGDV